MNDKKLSRSQKRAKKNESSARSSIADADHHALMMLQETGTFCQSAATPQNLRRKKKKSPEKRIGKSAKKLPPLYEGSSLTKFRLNKEHLQSTSNMSVNATAKAVTDKLITDVDAPHPSRIKNSKSYEKHELAVIRMPTNSPQEREHLRTTTNNVSPVQSMHAIKDESSLEKVPINLRG